MILSVSDNGYTYHHNRHPEKKPRLVPSRKCTAVSPFTLNSMEKLMTIWEFEVFFILSAIYDDYNPLTFIKHFYENYVMTCFLKLAFHKKYDLKQILTIGNFERYSIW